MTEDDQVSPAASLRPAILSWYRKKHALPPRDRVGRGRISSVTGGVVGIVAMGLQLGESMSNNE